MWLQTETGRRPTALVTGGSVGLGFAMARLLVREDFDVFICARTAADLETACRAEPALHAIQADVSRAPDRERLFEEIEAATGRPLDCLVNNAAIVRAHDYLNPFTLGEDRARDEIEINFAAPVEMARLYLKRRTDPAAPGAIVNISTPGALFPLDANLLYSATKAGFHMFTLGLRRHLAASPVKVIEVFPPSMDTGLARELEVSGQAANGGDVIEDVARQTVAGLLRGDPAIYPHEQSRGLCETFPDPDPALVETINSGVKRRPGWDRAG